MLQFADSIAILPTTRFLEGCHTPSRDGLDTSRSFLTRDRRELFRSIHELLVRNLSLSLFIEPFYFSVTQDVFRFFPLQCIAPEKDD